MDGTRWMSSGTQVIVVAVLVVALMPVVTAFDEDRAAFTVDIALFSEEIDAELLDIMVGEAKPTNFGLYEMNDPTHRIVMFSRDDEELFTQDVYIDFEMHPWEMNHSVVERQDMYWRLPYYWEAQNLTIYGYTERFEDIHDQGHGHDHNGHDHDHGADDSFDPETAEKEIALTVDLEDEFCNGEPTGECLPFCDGKQIDVDCSCGDGTCHPHETEETCPADCVAEVGTTDEDMPIDPADTDDEEPLISPLVGAVAAVLLLIIIGFGLYVWKIRGRQNPQQDYQQGYNQGYQQQGYQQGYNQRQNQQGYQQDNQYDRRNRY